MTIARKTRTRVEKSSTVTSHPKMFRGVWLPRTFPPAYCAKVERVVAESKGTLLRPMTCRLTEYRPVMTRMPARRPLILNFVASTPVSEPAMNPAAKLAAEAVKGSTPFTTSAATTAAPSVLDPSAVMSGNSKIRKLINTPNASRERMKPMVIAPIRRLIPDSFRRKLRNTSYPTRPAHEFTLARSGN